MSDQILQSLQRIEKRLDEMVTKDDAKNLLTKDDTKNFATKDDIQMLMRAILSLGETQGQAHHVLSLADKRLNKIESSK